MNAKIVIGLGFGDEGKGRVVDHLCSQASNGIVVRFSGGHQCGHTVTIKEKRHVHSNYGAGTLRGLPSYFTEHTCFYLNTMEEERRLLRGLGAEPELYIHPLANMTTPYDVAWNRLTEKKNGHGSCGLGIAATMKRNLHTPYKLYAVDTLHPQILFMKLEGIKDYYRRMCKEAGFSEEEFDEICPDMRFLALCRKNTMFKVMGYDFLFDYEDVIFEGSQGVLLDMDHGIFPNVTYANTTSKNAMEVLKNFSHARITMYYVTRCYQTRHGNGWMSNEETIELVNNFDETNIHNPWQGWFRTGKLDYGLLNYAIAIEGIYSSQFPCHLAVTCLDHREGFKFSPNAIKHEMTSFQYFSSPVEEPHIFHKKTNTVCC